MRTEYVKVLLDTGCNHGRNNLQVSSLVVAAAAAVSKDSAAAVTFENAAAAGRK